MKKILVSAGHTNKDGQDRGAAGNGFIEGVEATKIRDAVAARLRDRGFTVIEDGDDGINDPLTKAIALAKTADIAVEFHFNAGPPTATGTEVLSKINNKALAQRIGTKIGACLKIPVRGEDGWKSDKSGQHHRLGFCEAGGLIAEICFISNAKDMAAYRNNFDLMCIGLANAIGGVEKPAEAPKEPAPIIGHEPEPESITVKSGDNLWAIATDHHTTVTELRKLNPHIKADRIFPGDKVRVR